MYKGFILLGLLCLTLIARAGEESRILFNRLDVNNGLSSNEVSSIYKDQKGFMWFGTGAGLTRYDGYEFKTFRHDVEGSLYSEEFIIKITETADGNLWITYQDGKISVFDPHRICFFTVPEISKVLRIDRRIVHVFQDQDYQLLFTTETDELLRYNFSSGTVSSYPVTPSEENVSDVGRKGHFFYVVYHSGLVELIDLRQNKCILKNDYLKTIHNPKRFDLFVDSDGELWIYMDPENYNGIYRFSPDEIKWTHYTTVSAVPLSSSMIRDVEEDPDGMIWIATDHGGINLFDKQKNTVTYLKNNPSDPKTISQNSVICLYKDNTGIVWNGTYKNGINYYHESIFKFTSLRYTIQDAEDAGINDCNCVHEDTQGNLWIGTNGNGLLHYDRKTKTYRKYQHDTTNPNSISSNIVVSLTSDRQGNLWIGTYLGGLDCFDGRRFTHYRSDMGTKGVSNNSIYCLYADENDNLWIGTLGDGLNRLNLRTDKWTYFRASDVSNPLLSNNVYSIAEGGKNELLIGTSLGVNILDSRNDNIIAFRGTKDGKVPFKDKAINTVFLDSQNLMWIGSNNGLSIYDVTNDKLYHLDKTDGLPDNDVMSVMEDTTHHLWLGTKNGLLYISPQYYPKEGQYRFQCTTYYENEGIQGRVFNRNSIYKNASEEIIFGGTNGLTLFHPAHIRYNASPPEVVVTNFLLQNQSIQPGVPYNGKVLLQEDISYSHAIDLTYDERSFMLTISALNYFLPDKSGYSFMMEGFDKKWTTIDAVNRTITYTNLPPGNYTFIVKAENNDGVLSKEPTKLAITIHPPIWGTNWAIFLYFLMGAFVVYLLTIALIRVQKRKFEKEQEQITAHQLHEMDEMKLRFFTNVSHEFRTPLTLILAPVEKLMKGEANAENKQVLKLVYENARQLLQLVNQLLDFRKIDVQGVQLLLSSGDIVIFVRNIVYSFKGLSEQKNIRFSFSTSFQSLIMQFDTDKVFKIVSNLLSNAFKFTPEGGMISVTLQLHQSDDGVGRVQIQVSDTGIGIPADKQELIFNRFYQISTDEKRTVMGTGIGLHICREFVKLHNGTISVKSEWGKGSMFTVSLPAKLPELQEIITAPETVGAVTETVPASFDARKSTVLLVDDNPDFLDFMRLSLNGLYNIYTAGDGEDAWEIILDELPDMVVSDVMMPVTDGIVLCKRIKQDLRTSHIPVILLTAKSAEDSRLMGLEAGADDYIGKPFNMDILLLKIKHLIEFRLGVQKQFREATQNRIPLTEIKISSIDDALMRKTIAFIEEHLTDPMLTVESLGREMGMSRANFYKKIVSLTGKTPVELIRMIRLKRAVILLEKGQMRVNEVAAQVGFNDSKLFRKYFKDEFGRLPSDYVSKS